MTIPAPEPDPHARESASGNAAAVGGATGGAAAPGRGELRLLVAPERDDPGAVADMEVTPSTEALLGAITPARRLRLAAPVQLELVSGRREGPGPEVVWASLPERAREAVLVLLARLIDAGVVEEGEA